MHVRGSALTVWHRPRVIMAATQHGPSVLSDSANNPPSHPNEPGRREGRVLLLQSIEAT